MEMPAWKDGCQSCRSYRVAAMGAIIERFGWDTKLWVGCDRGYWSVVDDGSEGDMVAIERHRAKECPDYAAR